MTPLTGASVLEALKAVIDPELGYNIVDLGLIYGVTLGEGTVEIVMTMTTPGCPAGNYIQDGVQECLESIEGVEDASVKVVWTPQWEPSMMSDDAKAFFGFA